MSEKNSTSPRSPSVNDAKIIRVDNDPSLPEDHTSPETKPPDEDVIAQLASMTPLEYERVRHANAKEIGCRPSVLDQLVKDRKDGNRPDASIPPAPVTPVRRRLFATTAR